MDERADHLGKDDGGVAIQQVTDVHQAKGGGQINVDGITERGSMWGAPTLGYFEWMLLREDYFKKMRELDQKGTLKDFHDRIYKIGFIPIPLVRETLFHQLEQQYRPRTATSAG